MTVLTETLVARTVPLDPAHAPALAAVAGASGFLLERDGQGLGGRGVALRIALPVGLATRGAADRVSEVLGAVRTEDEVGLPGTGPIALGALPFDADVPASLIVPRLTVGRSSDGTAWMTTVGRAGSHVETPNNTPRGIVPDSFTLTPSLTHKDWEALIAQAVDDIRAGRLKKVVLAREVLVEANRDIDVPSVLERLKALYPSCLVFSIDGFVGASPELLIQRSGRTVRSHPLAGTIPRSGDPETDAVAATAFLASDKERSEHRFVVEDVADVLATRCTWLQVPDAPAIVSLRNVSHLGTRIEGTLADPVPTALELVAMVHPTAAVGGAPRPAALAWLRQHEKLDRGPYAGPVGWVDRHGDGEWQVGIRCALIDGAHARLFAGVGVVADSDPVAELAETQLKLQALLAAVVRP